MGLSADVQAIVDNGKERYEDSVVCDTIRYYIMYVGNIPASAWGEMPWVARWRTEWATARDARVTEAATARDVCGDTGSALIQVAADYSHTDITAALDFDISSDNADLQPFLDATNRSGPTVSAHPGGSASSPTYFPGGAYKPTFSDSTDGGRRLKLLSGDGGLNTPQLKSPGSVTDQDRAMAYFGDTPGRKELEKFVLEHYDTLKTAESLVDQFTSGLAKHPTTDFIDEARNAWPRVIINRADLMLVARNNYREMRDELHNDTEALKTQWWSDGAAQAYYTHANNILKYFDTIATELDWLATEGKKAGDAIDRLMLAYAQAGYNEIGNIIKYVQDVKDEMNSALCPDPENAAKALLGVLNALASVMLSTWQKENDAAQNMLNVSKVAQDNQPDLGTSGHGSNPFPQEAVDGNSWKSGSGWGHEGRRTIPVGTA
jgi:hypothetical protein